jgi:hypothetical protein
MNQMIQNTRPRDGQPRASLNKFVEYATTPKAGRRKQIVCEQVNPKIKPIPYRYIEA